MKKKLPALFLVFQFLGMAQCITPTNLVINEQITQTFLNWTGDSSALTYGVTVIPNFDVGTPLPAAEAYVSNSNQITISNLPLGCNAYFVRSQCAFAPAVYSNWAIILSFNCSPNAFAYAATLSNNVYNLDTNKIKLYPNPAQNILNIETLNNETISSVKVYTILGQEVLSTMNSSSTINIENLTTGAYFIKVKTEHNELKTQFIKN